MAPKRTRNPAKPTFDEIQAEVNNKRLLHERQFEPDRDVTFYLQIRSLHLQRMIQVRQPVNDTFVRHFYAHARFYSMNRLSFRNHSISSFRPQGIQSYYRLPIIQECQYKAMMANPAAFPFDEILATLGTLDARWVQPHHGQSYLKRADLNRDAKTWLHFITSNVMPTMHLSHVPQKTALLIYLLITEQPVNIADIIFDTLFDTIYSKRKGQRLIFPHLISDMYRNDGVPELDSDLKIQPMPVLKYERVQDDIPGRGPAGPGSPAASMEMEEDAAEVAGDEEEVSTITLTSLSRDIQRIERGLDREARYRKRVDAYRRQMDVLMAQHLGFSLPPEPIESDPEDPEEAGTSAAPPEADAPPVEMDD